MPNYRNQTTGVIAANGAAVTLEWRETFNGGVGVQLAGTWSGTLQTQISLDGTTYEGIVMRPVSTEVGAVNMTQNGIYYANVIGAKNLRVTATAWTSGTGAVTLVGLPG
jgi:hypothetical protein